MRHDQIEFILGKNVPLSSALQQFRDDMALSLNRTLSVNFFVGDIIQLTNFKGIPFENEIPMWLIDKRPKFEVQIIRPPVVIPSSPSSPLSSRSTSTVIPIPVECDVNWTAYDLLKFLTEKFPFLFSELKVDPFDYCFKLQGIVVLDLFSFFLSSYLGTENYLVTLMKLLAFEQIQHRLRFNRPIVLLLVRKIEIKKSLTPSSCFSTLELPYPLIFT